MVLGESGSDGEAVNTEGVLGRYVRELGLLTLEQAVHKMTGLNAKKVGFPLRGRIAKGSWADLTLSTPRR